MKIRASRTARRLRQQSPGKSGSLCQFTQLKTAKDGSTCEYPTIGKERDPDAIEDWYWHYTYKLKNQEGKFVTHTKTFPRRKVATVRDLIAQNTSVAGILEYLHSPLLIFSSNYLRKLDRSGISFMNRRIIYIYDW